MVAMVDYCAGSFILPIYLNQSGIQKMGPEHHSIVVSATLMIAVLASSAVGIVHLHLFIIIFSCVVALILILQTIWR